MFLKTCESCVKLLNSSKRFYGLAVKKQIENIKPLISCRRKEYNFYGKHSRNNLEEIKYASKGWHHNKSKGDYFILHMTEDFNIFENISFAKLGLNHKIIEALEKHNLTQPTTIQSRSVPTILNGRNTIIAAETGCGKTLAYLLPTAQMIMQQKSTETKFNSPLCLILSPSRELAQQIYEVATNLLSDLDIKTSLIIGGSIKRKMLNPNVNEIDILVATPGAFSKLTTVGIYKTDRVEHVVIDEADTLLDESFSEKLSYILKRFPFSFSKTEKGVQLTLVSATMPTLIPDVVSDIILPESLTKITTDNLHKALQHVPQRFLRIGFSMKPSQLLALVKNDYSKNYPVMIFSNNSGTCDWISMFLNENGVRCVNLNAGMNLHIRKDRFKEFQSGEYNVISTTDVGSRGLDTTRVGYIRVILTINNNIY